MKHIRILLLVLFLSGCSIFRPEPPNILTLPGGIVEKVAQPIPERLECVDALAGCLFPDELRAIPNHMSVGMFLTPFCRPDKSFDVIKGELAAGRVHMRINLMWSDTHSYGSQTDVQFITGWSRELNNLCIEYGPRLQIAPFTEHNLKNPDQYLSIVKANAPNCGKPVNSVYNGAFTKNPEFENEVHGSHNPPKVPGVDYSYSFDGTNAADSDFKKMQKKHAKAKRFCSWAVWDNLRYRSKDTTSRAQRIAEAKDRKPTKDMLLSEVYWFTPLGSVKLKQGLVKSHAEKHDKNDQKGNKLLVILKVKAKFAYLKEKGKEIGKAILYGSFDGCKNCWRYYFPQMGFKYGPGIKELFADKKKVGDINPGFRFGSAK